MLLPPATLPSQVPTLLATKIGMLSWRAFADSLCLAWCHPTGGFGYRSEQNFHPLVGRTGVMVIYADLITDCDRYPFSHLQKGGRCLLSRKVGHLIVMEKGLMNDRSGSLGPKNNRGKFGAFCPVLGGGGQPRPQLRCYLQRLANGRSAGHQAPGLRIRPISGS